MSETLIPLFSSLVMVSDIQLNETEEKIILDFFFADWNLGLYRKVFTI